MNELYEVLEICLQDIERGENIETILFRYPEYADELRPILEGSMNARSMAIPAPSSEVVRRNRAKVLQYAAQMREGQVQTKSSSRRIWFASLRRIVVTLAIIAMLFVSGTGLVSAASTTLPGDNLYPVKRTWEDVLLMLTFNLQEREALEIQRENTRLHELRELFAAGRSAEVEFSGVATSQNGNEWVIAGIRVVISSQTEVSDGPLAIGSAIRVKGHTQGDGIVLAERVRLLDPDEKLPSEVEIESEDHEDDEQGEDNSGKGSHDDESGDGENKGSGSGSDTNDDSSNSGSGSNNSGSGSDDNENDNGNDSSDDNSGSSNDDNSGSGKDENSGSNDNGDDDHNGGSGEHDSGSSDDSGGGGDNSGSGGGGGGDD